MKILVVEKTFPWPQMSGSHIRVANIMKALATLGDVDLFVVRRDSSDPCSLPLDEPINRFTVVGRPASGYRGMKKLQWLAPHSLPLELTQRDFSEVRSSFLGWAGEYDLAWVGRAENFVALSGLLDCPVVVDFDDLKDHRISGELSVRRDTHGSPPRSPLRGKATEIRDVINARRWRRLYRGVAKAADAVAVCSPDDSRRLGVANAIVVPNGYESPDRPLGRIEVGEPPVLMLAGLFTYGPNIDAARFFVEDVLPRLRARRPDACVRLVGRYDHRVEHLGRVDGVTLTGWVRDMRQELASADVAIVPVRFGTGTRVKVLEAFAHRIPVVSTTVGCEGLGTLDGKHLLVRDDPDGMASACAELLTDVSLRRRLTDQGVSLYRRKYRWSVIGPEIARLASSMAAGERRNMASNRESHPKGTLV